MQNKSVSLLGREGRGCNPEGEEEEKQSDESHQGLREKRETDKEENSHQPQLFLPDTKSEKCPLDARLCLNTRDFHRFRGSGHVGSSFWHLFHLCIREREDSLCCYNIAEIFTKHSLNFYIKMLWIKGEVQMCPFAQKHQNDKNTVDTDYWLQLPLCQKQNTKTQSMDKIMWTPKQ